MSSQYNGNGTLPVAAKSYLAVAIASSTNASPIVVTTSSAHGFNNGDTVVVEGHLVNTAANGRWQIAVLTSTTFALNNSTGVGVGAATGYVLDYSVTPQLTIPGDGDNASVSSFNPALQAAANLTPYLYERVGNYRLYGIYTASSTTLYSGSAWSQTTISSSASWATLTNASALLTWSAVGPAGQSAAMQIGDLIEIAFTNAEIATQGGGSAGQLGVALGLSLNGGSMTPILAGTQYFLANSSTLSYNGPPLYATYQNTGLGWETFQIGLMAILQSGMSSTVTSLFSPWSLTVKHYRPNA